MTSSDLTRRASFAALAAPVLLANDGGPVAGEPAGATIPQDMRLNIFDFLDEQAIASIGQRDRKVDITDALQRAVDHAFAVGAVIHFPAGSYVISKTISLEKTNYKLSAGLEGENGNSTRIYFDGPDGASMFSIGPGVNYFVARDLEFIDANARRSKGFHFRDDASDGSWPSWKHLFFGVRIVDFAEGCRFDGGLKPSDDRHESEVMFLHSKFRNCATSIAYNNIQAVNHQLIGTDFENDHPDDESAKWPMIKFERGTFVNHVGGSVVGYGPYVTYTYPADPSSFQATSQFRSVGVRLEGRGNGPFILHGEASEIIRSNVFRVIVEGMSVISYKAHSTPVLAQFGGRTLAVFKECNANQQMTIDAVVTANLIANGEFGAIFLDRCKAIVYNRVVSRRAYGSGAASSASAAAIPAEISTAVESSPVAIDEDGFLDLRSSAQTVYAGGWQGSGIKTLTYAPSEIGGAFQAGSALLKIKVPPFAQPFKLRLLRQRGGGACSISLIASAQGRDMPVARINLLSQVAGHFEANLQLPTGLPPLLRDDDRWDGRMKIIKEGVGEYDGLIMIDYM